jgi:hypothetical protein
MRKIKNDNNKKSKKIQKIKKANSIKWKTIKMSKVLWASKSKIKIEIIKRSILRRFKMNLMNAE